MFAPVCQPRRANGSPLTASGAHHGRARRLGTVIALAMTVIPRLRQTSPLATPGPGT